LLSVITLSSLNPTFPAGYNHPVDEVLDELLVCLDHPALPLLQWRDELSFVESRLPAGVAAKLEQATADHEAALTSSTAFNAHSQFPGRALINILNEAIKVSFAVGFAKHVFGCLVLSAGRWGNAT
jgi:hypothetical protein